MFVDQVLRDLARIHGQIRTITNREQHLREVIMLTTITTAVEEVPMHEVQVTEVVLLLEVTIRQVAVVGQVVAIARQVVAVAQVEATVRQVAAAAVRAALAAAQVAAAVAHLVANLAGEVNKSHINLGN